MTLDVFTSADADSEALAGETVAVIGYGNLGSSMAKQPRCRRRRRGRRQP